MFNELKSKTAQAYCSLIKGMAMHNEYKGANDMYEQMKHYNLVPDLNTINALIKLIIMAPDSVTNENKIDLMMEKLNEIKDYEIMPNLKTFNSCFELIKSFNLYQSSIPVTLNLFKEMQNLKIEPCLATYSHIVSIFYPNRDIGSKTGILKQVITQVESMVKKNGAIEWKDTEDGTFFVVSMKRLFLGSKEENISLAKRLHSILLKNNNIAFLNDSHLFNKYL